MTSTKFFRSHYVAVTLAACLPFGLSGVVHAESAYQVDWIAQIGTSATDVSTSAAIDNSGNIYISGRTNGSLGGPYSGNGDAFLTKFDSFGVELWSQQIGTVGIDHSYSVAVDDGGNAYISGRTTGSLGGPHVGSWDSFLTKLDTSGAELWSRQIGTSTIDESWSVAVDGIGNAIISGRTSGSLGGSHMGNSDAFLTKFDASGTELWSRQIGTETLDESWAVAVDDIGNIYISGITAGNLGGSHAGGGDAFLTKFDAAGNELWSQQIGTTDEDWSLSVALDGEGNAYIAGNTTGSLGGPNAGAQDAFLVKFDPLGNELWSQQIGTPDHEQGLSVTVDSAGNIYMSGGFAGILNAADEDIFDIYLAKFDSLGTQLWIQQIGTVVSDASTSVVVGDLGAVYISGYTDGDLGGPNAGGRDAFLAKFTIPEPTTSSLLVLGGLSLVQRRRNN